MANYYAKKIIIRVGASASRRNSLTTVGGSSGALVGGAVVTSDGKVVSTEEQAQRKASIIGDVGVTGDTRKRVIMLPQRKSKDVPDFGVPSAGPSPTGTDAAKMRRGSAGDAMRPFTPNSPTATAGGGGVSIRVSQEDAAKAAHNQSIQSKSSGSTSNKSGNSGNSGKNCTKSNSTVSKENVAVDGRGTVLLESGVSHTHNMSSTTMRSVMTDGDEFAEEEY